MDAIKRLRQYVSKASFASAIDRDAAQECIDEIAETNNLKKNLRRVMVTEWVGVYPKKVELKETREADFHGWGNDYEELESGTGNYTVAVVEFDDGTIEMVRADRVRFLDRINQTIVS